MRPLLAPAVLTAALALSGCSGEGTFDRGGAPASALTSTAPATARSSATSRPPASTAPTSTPPATARPPATPAPTTTSTAAPTTTTTGIERSPVVVPGPYTITDRAATPVGGGVTVRLVAITEDSRCPEHAQCVWAGELEARIAWTVNGAETPLDLLWSLQADPSPAPGSPGIAVSLQDAARGAGPDGTWAKIEIIRR